MRQAILDALDSVTHESAEQAFVERHGADIAALRDEMIAKARRLDAAGKLDEAASALIRAEFTARASDIGQAFAQEFFAALVDTAVAVDAAQRPRLPARRWLKRR